MKLGLTMDWEQMASEAKYDVHLLARINNVSVRQLQRHFKSHFKQTPQRWLTGQRLLAARELLELGEPLKKVSIDLGFKQLSHFCRQFKTVNGLTPSQYRTKLAYMSLLDNNVVI